MFGPRPPGFRSEPSEPRWKGLERGRSYRVVNAFTDDEGDTHEIGETWEFAGSSYLPYDAGLSLFVRTGEGEWHIPLQLRHGRDDCVGTHIDRYVERV